MSCGRKRDPMWTFFDEIKPSEEKKSVRAKCKKCKIEMVGLVARMKIHLEKCTGKRHSTDYLDISHSEDEDIEDNENVLTVSNTLKRKFDTPSSSSSGSTFSSQGKRVNLDKSSGEGNSALHKFITRTSQNEREKLDIQVARFIYGTNSPFKHVEHIEFVNMIKLLRPGYKPPNRKQVANELLDEVYDSVTVDSMNNLNGKTVCMALDGWSNTHNDPILCFSVTDILDEYVHLIDTIDSADNSHTAQYLLQLATSGIKTCQQKYGCVVRSFVTDNAANMSKMREELAKTEECGLDIITYGCSAHILNLFAHDIDIPEIKEHIKKVIKYFRNSHFASSKYKQAGGKSLILPQDVRWNTLADCIESYIANWHIMSKVCSENRAAIDVTIASKVNNINIKMNAEDFLVKLKKIAIALDKVQKDACTIGEATEIWISLLLEFGTDEDVKEKEVSCLKKRFEMAMTPAHFLAHILDPRFRGATLDQEHIDSAMEYLENYHPTVMPEVIKYRAKVSPFKEYLFSKHALEDVKPLTWWLALEDNVSVQILDLVKQLHSAVASSAGIERLFSSFGLVHSKIRNKLGTEKAAKLVSVFRALNRQHK